MFSTSIRSRPDLTSLVPTLSSSASGLRETALHAHDLSIPLSIQHPTPNTNNPNTLPTLKCILLTPLSLTPPHLPSALQRIERLTTLTASRALTAVVFVMAPLSPTQLPSSVAPAPSTVARSGNGDGHSSNADIPTTTDATEGAFEAYMRLQTIVEEMGLREAPPLLPVLSKEGTVQVVRGYAGGLFGAGDGDGNGVEVEVDVRRDLLALGTCTAPTKPLSEHTTFVLGDLAHSLRDVATMATTGSGKRKLAEFLEEREVGDIVDFWGEEWIAD